MNAAAMTPEQRETVFNEKLEALKKEYGVMMVGTLIVPNVGIVRVLDNTDQCIMPGPQLSIAVVDWKPEGKPNDSVPGI